MRQLIKDYLNMKALNNEDSENKKYEKKKEWNKGYIWKWTAFLRTNPEKNTPDKEISDQKDNHSENVQH